jgi:hypothetical protein
VYRFIILTFYWTRYGKPGNSCHGIKNELGMITVRLSLAAIRTVATQGRIFYSEATDKSSVDDSDDPSAYCNIPCHHSHCMSANPNVLSSEVYHYKCPFELPNYMKCRGTA